MSGSDMVDLSCAVFVLIIILGAVAIHNALDMRRRHNKIIKP